MNLDDPTNSRAMRDDYSALLKYIIDKFIEETNKKVKSFVKKSEPPLSIEVFAKQRSYDPTKLYQSLRTKLKDIDRRLIERAIRYQAKQGVKLALQQVQQKKNIKGITGQFINEGTLNELQNVNASLVESVQQDYVKRLKVELLLARFIGGGTLTWDKLVRGITKITNISRNRAEQIARTEVIRTIEVAKYDIYKQLGIKTWRWITANDDIVCRICWPLDGEMRNVGTPFTQNITNPPAHPNCRCGTEMVA